MAQIRTTPSDPETGETYGPAPLSVDFDASGSTDPENEALSYEWDFGDGGDTASGPNASHTYQTAGAYTATLTVTDERGNADTASTTVYAGNDGPPRPVIDSITVGGEAKDTFEVGQQISLQGSSAPDANGPVELRWNVIRHHTAPNTHAHAYEEFGDGTASFDAPAPEDLLSTGPEGNYLQVVLTATDSQGLSRTVSRDLRPETTDVRFSTSPNGFFVTVGGERVRAPRTLLLWEGSTLNVYAPPQTNDGRRYVFSRWSDGGASRHEIVVPEEDAGYIAGFKRK